MKYRILEKCRDSKIYFYPQKKLKFSFWFSCFYAYDYHADGDIPVKFTTLYGAQQYITSDMEKRARKQVSYTKIHDIR